MAYGLLFPTRVLANRGLVDNKNRPFGGVLQPKPAVLVAGNANGLWKVSQVPRLGPTGNVIVHLQVLTILVCGCVGTQ